MRALALTCVLLVSSTAGAATLEGTVREAGNRRAIPGAVVYTDTPPVEAFTDQDGKFRLDLGDIPASRMNTADAVTLFVKTSGFEETIIPVTLTGASTTLDLYIEQTGEIEGTLVRERRSPADVARGMHRIEEREVNELPGTYGDPAKAIENFPGMGRVVRSQGSLLVRGATPGETAVFVDDFEIPDLYHFTGSTSVINIPFVESVELVPGAFSARYGRATGGMVRLQTRKLPTDDFHGFAKLDVIDGGAYVGVPIADNLAVGASARRSYIDVARNTQVGLLGSSEVTLIPTYWDYQFKLDWDPAPGHEIVAFVFGSGDRELYTLAGDESVAPFNRNRDSDFHRVALRSRDALGYGFVNTVSAVTGLEHRYDDEQYGRKVEARTTWDAQFREELQYRGDDFVILGGLDGTARLNFMHYGGLAVPDTVRAVPSPQTQQSLNGQQLDTTVLQTTLAAFVEGTWEPVETLFLTPGLRIDGYYFGGIPHLSIEPRFAGSYDVLRGLYGMTLKASGGVFGRPPDVEEVSAAQLFGETLSAQTAIHLQSGFEQHLGAGNSFTATLYGIYRTRQVDRAPDFPVGERPYLSPVADTSSGYSYGAEFLLRTGASDRYFAWLSYSIAKHIRADGPSPRGVDYLYASPFDANHLLTLVGQVKLWWGFRVGGRGRMATGMPETAVTGSIYDSNLGRSAPVFGAKGASRFPNFYALDARLDWQYVFDWCTLDLYADLVNILNLRLVEGTLYNHDFTQQQPLLGLPTIPSLGFKVTW